ncbi:hypothetical protein VTP01DRAFT_1229 [Rhizomucor pusillus]|uniref:uncharacterized protein n=1 Tax=Rhizomucor pusillus TaxID=4840 RepID=UPI003742C63F
MSTPSIHIIPRKKQLFSWMRTKHPIQPEHERVTPSSLMEGRIYLLRVSTAHIAIFQGLDEDLYCFTILRYLGGSQPLRWSEARYIASDFAAYEAFDDDGNPLIQFWYELGAREQATHWFVMFEEACRKQRELCTAVPTQTDSSQEYVPPPPHSSLRRSPTLMLFQDSEDYERSASPANKDPEYRSAYKVKRAAARTAIGSLKKGST